MPEPEIGLASVTPEDLETILRAYEGIASPDDVVEQLENETTG